MFSPTFTLAYLGPNRRRAPNRRRDTGSARHGLIAQIAGWVFFAIAALGLLRSLQFALNTAWDVVPPKMGVWQTVRRRAVSFAMMLAVAALLLLSVIADAALTAVLAYLPHAFGGQATLVKGADFVLSFAIVWLLFAVLFEFLPDTRSPGATFGSVRA